MILKWIVKGLGYEVVDRIQVAQYGVQWKCILNTAINVWVLKVPGIS
jgi:hypothetical protein